MSPAPAKNKGPPRGHTRAQQQQYYKKGHIPGHSPRWRYKPSARQRLLSDVFTSRVAPRGIVGPAHNPSISISISILPVRKLAAGRAAPLPRRGGLPTPWRHRRAGSTQARPPRAVGEPKPGAGCAPLSTLVRRCMHVAPRWSRGHAVPRYGPLGPAPAQSCLRGRLAAVFGSGAPFPG